MLDPAGAHSSKPLRGLFLYTTMAMHHQYQPKITESRQNTPGGINADSPPQLWDVPTVAGDSDVLAGASSDRL